MYYFYGIELYLKKYILVFNYYNKSNSKLAKNLLSQLQTPGFLTSHLCKASVYVRLHVHPRLLKNNWCDTAFLFLYAEYAINIVNYRMANKCIGNYFRRRLHGLRCMLNINTLGVKIAGQEEQATTSSDIN